jgi:hypothetical protein
MKTCLTRVYFVGQAYLLLFGMCAYSRVYPVISYDARFYEIDSTQIRVATLERNGLSFFFRFLLFIIYFREF